MSKLSSVKKRIIAALLAVVMLCVAVFAFGNPLKALAFFDEKTAARFGAYSAEHEIENCSLFIGTYIIHKDSLEDFYDKAIDSQGPVSQYTIYYKSELNNGQWMDITNPDGGIRDISEGEPVDPEEMKDLFVTYMVSSDGTVLDYKGEMVNPFNTPDPYDIASLPEFETAKMLFDQKCSEDSSSHTMRYYYKFISTFFKLDLSNDVTDECDEQIDALWPAYRALKGSGQEEEAAILYKLIGKIDSKRKAEIYYQLAEAGDKPWLISENKVEGAENERTGHMDADDENAKSYVQAMIEVLSSENIYNEWAYNNDHFSLAEIVRYLQGGDETASSSEGEDGEETEAASLDMGNLEVELEDTPYENGTSLNKQEFQADSSFVDAFTNALSQCQATYNEHLLNQLDSSDTIIGKAEYSRALAIVEAAKGGLTGDMIAKLQEINRIYNINDGVVSEAALELEILESELIPQASSKYEDEVLAGVGDAYTKAVANGASETVTEGILDEQKSTAETARAVLENFISEKIKRVPAATGVEFCDERLDWTEGLFAGIPDDSFKKSANASATDHKLFLSDKKDEIINSNKDLQSEHDKLAEQKDNLNAQKQKALDDQDQNLANRIDAKLAEIDEALGNTKDDEDLNKDLAEKAKSKILNGENASAQLNAIAQSGDEDALKNLKKDLQDAGVGGSGTDSDGNAKNSAIDDIDSAIKDAKQAKGEAASKSTGLSEQQINGIIEDAFGDEFDDLSDEDQASATAAVGWFGQTGANTAQQMAITMSNKCMSNGNDYAFLTLLENGMEYAPLETIASATGYRYVFEPRRRQATLTNNKDSMYLFISGTKQVTVSGSEEINMSNKARFGNNTIYIDEEATKTLFGLAIEPTDGTANSLLLTGAMRKQAIELLEAFKDAL